MAQPERDDDAIPVTRVESDTLPVGSAPVDFGEVTTLRARTPPLGLVGLVSLRGNELVAEAEHWDVLVSCLQHDVSDREIEPPRDVLPETSPMLIEFPTGDQQPPASLIETVALIARLRAVHVSGQRILIGCKAGCGRSGTLAACLLVAEGSGVLAAIGEVESERRRTLRPRVSSIIETDKQRHFVDLFARAWAVVGPEFDPTALTAPFARRMTKPPADFRDVPGSPGNTAESALDALTRIAATDSAGPLANEIVRLGRALRSLVGDFDQSSASERRLAAAPASLIEDIRWLINLSTSEDAPTRSRESPRGPEGVATGPVGRAGAPSESASQASSIFPDGAPAGMEPNDDFESHIASHPDPHVRTIARAKFYQRPELAGEPEPPIGVGDGDSHFGLTIIRPIEPAREAQKLILDYWMKTARRTTAK